MYQLAHIHENRGPHVLVACAVLSALATISVGLRILVRWRTRSKIQADDHTIFLTLVRIHLSKCLYGQSVNAPSRFWHGHRSLEFIMVCILTFYREVSSFLLETINGLGMHLLAVTPTQLVAMTKVGLCTTSLVSQRYFDTHLQAGSAFHRTNIPNCRAA